MSEERDESGANALKLLSEYRERLSFAAARLTNDRYEQEDLVMRTLERAMDRWDNFDESKGTLAAWMSSIMHNLYVSDHRGKAVAAIEYADPLRIAGELSPNDNSTLEEVLARSDRDQVRLAISRLRPEDREAIIMFYFLDLPIARMAKILACPVGTVKSRLSRARSALGEILFNRLGLGSAAVVAGLLLALTTTWLLLRGGASETDVTATSSAPVFEECFECDPRYQSIISYAKREGVALYGQTRDGDWELANENVGRVSYVSYRL